VSQGADFILQKGQRKKMWLSSNGNS